MLRPSSHNKQPSQCQKPLPLNECIAKTYCSHNQYLLGHTVLTHCQIVGEVARLMLKRMPEWLRQRLLPHGAELVAAAHDIGKVSPTFQEKIYRGSDGYQKNSRPELKGFNPDIENEAWGGHAGVSLLTLKALNVSYYIPEIVGQHHGYTPPVGGKKADDACFGGPNWQTQRESLVQTLKETLALDWPHVQTPLQARVLAGLTTVADWIGSGSFFEDPNQDWRPLLKKALDQAGWCAPLLKKQLSFRQIFGFSPFEVQLKFIERVQKPGVYLLEAPMGLGKTEAALYAAYRMIDQGYATGLYFALPTQMTSDKIHDRVNTFLNAILDQASIHQGALLLHSQAWLKAHEMGEEGQPGGAWFQHSKRGVLAPFAVGTIDQALMAVMNVKHGFVRTFGLAGKVVILDEVHSYDTYTGTILDRLIDALSQLHCTVIILSATLTHNRRESLLGRPLAEQTAYPLITAYTNQSVELSYCQSLLDQPVQLRHIHDDQEAIDEALNRAEQGQHVLWIENTVNEAQVNYQLLAARAADLAIECGLLHSRYTQLDRKKLEAHWVQIYGKEATDRQRCGRILVGTQVLEQSLDIDADFLVTRICPTDMLLQRMGRLWRHRSIKRPANAVAESWILAPSLEAALTEAKRAFHPYYKVYDPYVLCRSLEVWCELSTVNLPSDIRPLLEATYQPRDETGAMGQYLHELNQQRQKLKQLALVGLSSEGQTLAENQAQTRYSEQDRVAVLLIKQVQYEAAEHGVAVTLMDNNQLLLYQNPKGEKRTRWRAKAALLHQHLVYVVDYLAPKPTPRSKINWLKGYIYLGDPMHEAALLRVVQVKPDGTLTGLDGESISEHYRLEYDSHLGYKAKK